MRSGAAWIASLMLLPLAGAPLAAHPCCQRLTAAARLAVAAACGAVSISWLMTLWALLGLRWNVPLLVAAALLLGAALRLAIPGEPAPAAPPREPAKLPERFAILILLASPAAALAATASGSASSPDLLLFWGPKAQAFAAARTIDAAFLGGPNMDYLHVSYPPLVPNVWALAVIVAGRFPWGAATLLFPLSLALLAAALPSLLRLAVSRRIALATAALAISIAGYTGSVFDIAGNADITLVFFETLAAALLVGPWALEAGGQLVAGIFLAGAVSAKVEGLAFAAAAGALFLLLRRRQLPWPGSALRLLLPSTACLAAWFALGLSRRLFTGYESYGRTFDIHWERIPLVAAQVGSALFSEGGGLPFLLPILALAAARGSNKMALVPAGAALLLAGFSFFTYLHGNPDPTLWIIWSAGRVFFPLSILLAIASAARSAADDREGQRAP